MADIGAQSTMQVQHMPVMLPGANGQPVMHYIAVGGMPGSSQQQQLAAWPVISPILLSFQHGCPAAMPYQQLQQCWYGNHFFRHMLGFLPATSTVSYLLYRGSRLSTFLRCEMIPVGTQLLTRWLGCRCRDS